MNIVDVVAHLKTEREKLDKAIQALTGLHGTAPRTGRKRTLSASARASIAAAQRARWAKVRAGKKGNVVAMPKRRPLSAAGRKRIAAAQKARWAKVRAAKKA